MYPTSDEFDRMLADGPDLAALDKDSSHRLCQFAYETFLPEFIADNPDSYEEHHFEKDDVYGRLKYWTGEPNDYKAEFAGWFYRGFFKRVDNHPNVIAFWTIELRRELAAEHIVSRFDKGKVTDEDLRRVWQDNHSKEAWGPLLHAVMECLHRLEKRRTDWIKAVFFPVSVEDEAEIEAVRKAVDYVKEILHSAGGRYADVVKKITKQFNSWVQESLRTIALQKSEEPVVIEALPVGEDVAPPSGEVAPNATVPHSHQVLLAEAQEWFDISETNALCFDMGINHEAIPHKEITEYWRELSRYVARRGPLFGILVTLVFRERPHLRQQTKFAELLRYDDPGEDGE